MSLLMKSSSVRMSEYSGNVFIPFYTEKKSIALKPKYIVEEWYTCK